MSMQESYYTGGHRILLAFVSWFLDVVTAVVPMTVFSRFVQSRAETTFRIVGWLLRLRGRPLPPQFNTDFVAADVPRGRAKWAAESPERSAADPVILYLHGGGYGLGLCLPQARALRELYFAVGNPRLSILALDYTTSVYAGFPTQLREAASLYNALAETCQNIVLFGDSAGGHLALQLVRHIAAPVDGVPRVTQKPAAFVGISPAIDLAKSAGVQSHRNTKHDILNIAMMHGWSDMYARTEEIAQSPLVRLQTDRAVEWAQVLPKHTFIAYGGREVLADAIEIFIADNDLKERGVTVYAHPLDFHDSLMMIGGAPSPMMEPTVEFLRQSLP